MSYVLSARYCPTGGTKLTKPLVFVVDAGGLLGKATVNAFSSLQGRMFDITAGFRDAKKLSSFKSKVGVNCVETNMSDSETLKETFRSVSMVCIIVPTTEDRVQLAINTARAAKEAGVHHILIYSIITADLTDTIFGKQFNEIETAIIRLNVPYTILRLPLYMDNYLAYEAMIKNEHTIYAPVDPTKQYTPVAVDDAASTAAAILVAPGKHAGKVYTIVSDRHTFADLAQAFTKGLSRKINYTQVSYEEARTSFVKDHRFPEWQAKGIMEMYKLVDAASPVVNPENTTDFAEITGKQTTNLLTWIMRHASGFQ